MTSHFANLFKVGYNRFEFVLDFGQAYPEEKPEQVHARITTAPSYAKALLKLLSESVEGYERSFGVITVVEDHDP